MSDRIGIAQFFTNANVRNRAPLAIEDLRSRGVWMVNAHLTDIKSLPGVTCFFWDHEYRSKTHGDAIEIIATCIQ